MARIPRIVVPGTPHHVTQRGARRLPVFLAPDDPRLYLDLLRDEVDRCAVEVWAYCLMPNHVHLVAVPAEASGLARALGEAHRRYAARINRREGWTGHLWQARFWSAPLDDACLRSAVRYVLFNPVRAGLVARPGEWPHSNAAALLAGRDSPLSDRRAIERRCGAPAAWLRADADAGEREAIRRRTTTGRPIGGADFLRRLESQLGRPLGPGAPGRPRVRTPGEVVTENPYAVPLGELPQKQAGPPVTLDQ